MRENRVQAFFNHRKVRPVPIRFDSTIQHLKKAVEGYAGRLYKTSLRLLLMKDSVIITQRKLEKNIIHMDVYIEN
ncbi:hypothetical protein [Lacrimispora indolis]|uniref:hypothetical protein n=1 Tax=Lacrimispora indolis TaxID=69825 RepID=UPI003564F84A